MANWLRLLVVLLIASFATGTYAQTTAATAMAFQMPGVAMDMNASPGCDHCKPGIVQHPGSCDALCLAAVVIPSAPSVVGPDVVSPQFEVRHFWGYLGEPLSPVPPPPKTIILS